MAMIRKMIYESAPLTPEQIKQIEEADKKPIVFDDDPTAKWLTAINTTPT